MVLSVGWVLVVFAMVVQVACGGSGSGDVGGAPDGSPRSAGVLGYASLVDFSQLATLKEGVSAHQVSSYDRSGGNRDFGEGPTGNSVLYEEDGRFFVLDEAGPGIVTRFWMTFFGARAAIDDPTALRGDIHIEVDGQTTTRVLLREYFSGDDPASPFPLASGPDLSGGGYISYRQLPFRERIRISVSNPLDFYQIVCHRLAPDVFDEWVQVYGALDAEQAAAVLSDPPRPVGRDRVHDQVELAPGESATIFALAGPARVVALDLDLDRSFEGERREAWISITWDDAPEPQVSAPIDFLFAVPEGGTIDSFPVRAVSGESYGIYFPMPFETSATVRLENRSRDAVFPRSSWRLSTEALASDAPRWGHFHASLRSSRRAADDPRDVVVLDTRGIGHLVGTVMLKACDGECTFVGFGFGHLEGDERILVDDASSPAFHGTGAEDYFNSGFYYLGGPYQLPTHGNTSFDFVPDAEGFTNRAAVYRWHLTDPIPFNRRLRFTIQHGPVNDMPVRFDSVAFYYRRPHPSWTGPIDRLDLGSAVDRDRHEYEDGVARVEQIESGFPGERSSDLLSHEVRYSDGAIHFRIDVSESARGIRLRRLFDASTGGQVATVFVDGEPAGVWLSSDSNEFHRWGESVFEIPPRMVRGRDFIQLRLEPETGVPFSAALYEAFAY